MTASMAKCRTRRIPIGTAVVAAGLIAGAAQWVRAAEAPEWTVDLAQSRITFTGRQMDVPSKGRFKTFSAKVRFDPANLAESRVEVVIDPASADTGNPEMDTELKRPNWFAVERFRDARFVTTALRAKGGNAYEAAARLTIRDVTQEVVMPFKLDIGDDGADPGQLLARASGHVTISRTKYGIGQAEWSDTNIVSDEVGIHVDLVARRKK
jgi:polyisoprenoid-binding protein YceI